MSIRLCDLPDDMIGAIAGHLGNKDRAHFRTTCRRLDHLVTETITAIKLPEWSSDCKTLIRRYTGCTHLDLCRPNAFCQEDWDLLASLGSKLTSFATRCTAGFNFDPQVRKLAEKAWQGGERKRQELQEKASSLYAEWVRTHFPRITQLFLQCEDRLFSSESKFIEIYPQLTKLTISFGNYYRCDTALSLIGKHCPLLQSLAFLWKKPFYSSPPDSSYVQSLVQGCPNLTSIDLGIIGDYSPLFSQTPLLTSIVLHVAGSNIPSFLSQCTSLTCLTVHGHAHEMIMAAIHADLQSFIYKAEYLDDQSILPMIKKCTHLRSFHSGDALGLTSATLKAFGKYCPRLEELTICSESSNLGVKELLQGCTRLKKLDLDAFSMDDGAFALFAQWGTALKILKIHSSHLTNKAARDFVRAHPHITLIVGYDVVALDGPNQWEEWPVQSPATCSLL